MPTKKLIRQRFRDAVFARDHYHCAMCPSASKELDAHHITDRSEMPNGGYVVENGITLCPTCHIKAEMFHATVCSEPDYNPAELYAKIKSSFEEAVRLSL